MSREPGKEKRMQPLLYCVCQCFLLLRYCMYKVYKVFEVIFYELSVDNLSYFL